MKNFVAAIILYAVYFDQSAALSEYYMDNNCMGTLDLTDKESLRLKLTPRRSYQPNMNCTLLVTSKDADQIMLYFKNFDVSYTAGCTRDWLEVHDGKDGSSSYVAGLPGNLCGSSMSDTVRTTVGSDLFLRFTSRGNTYQSKGFEMLITQFHTGPCNNSEFSCLNDRCISDRLVCNGYNPCGDYSDCAVVALAVGIIVAIVLASVVSCIVVTCLFVVCCRRRRRRIIRGVYQPVGVVPTNYGSGYNYT